MSDVGPNPEGEISAVERARQNLDLALHLDSIHPIGAAALSSFERDLIIAGITDSAGTPLSTSAFDIEPLVETEDLELLRTGLAVRAELSLSLLGDDLGDTDPYTYDTVHRDKIISHQSGSRAQSLFGQVLLVRRRSIFKNDHPEAGAVVLVGGLTESYPNKIFKDFPPNPSLHTLGLKPFWYKERNRWVWGKGAWDVECLGQLGNICFNPLTYTNPFKSSHGNARAYRLDLSDRPYNIPPSGDPADLQIEQPQTVLDQLVKNAVEAQVIQKRLFELEFPRRISA